MNNEFVPFTSEERESFLKLLRLAKNEDLGPGDITSRILPDTVHTHAMFTAREEFIFAGGPLLADIAHAYSEVVQTKILIPDGTPVKKGDVLAMWTGPAWAVMSAERVALNFIQRLSAVATVTSRYVKAAGDTKAKVLDTRKTTPGWRDIEKYAVRVGGGTNHRRGLYDAVLIKDNHLVALERGGHPTKLIELGSILEDIRPQLAEDGFIEVEVDTLEQLADALTLPVDIIMLDNMPPETINKAMQMRKDAGKENEIEFEASGGVNLKTIGAIAQTGVERISVGALTHSVASVDIGLDSDLD